MGICNSSSKIKSRSIRTKSVMNNNPGVDEYAEHRSKYQKEIKVNPFFILNSSLNQEKLVTQFENSNQTPNIFIASLNQSKYTLIFKKQFEICYLKCEPMLNNIYPTNQKESQLLFLNLSLFFLTNGSAADRKCDWAQRLLNEAYENNQKSYNIGKLNEIVKNVINIGMIIVIYFGAIFIFMNEEMKSKVFSEEAIRIEDKYLIGELDNYFFDKFQNKEATDEYFIEKWSEFIMSFIIKPEENQNHIINYENYFLSFSESQKEDFKYRFCHMCDPMCFFEVFLKFEVPKYQCNVYKNQLQAGLN